MKNILIIWVLAFLGTGVYAQNPKAKEKIESARIGFITERLGLTPDQAEKFWPLYNEFRTKNQEASVDLRSYRTSIDINEMTEEQSKRLVELDLQLKQRRLDLEKEYSQRMLGVISNQQVASLKRAERDFRDMLRRRIQQARQQQLRQRRLQNSDQIRDRLRDKYRD
ncbi:MAG: hypothetical protein OER04_13955 [Cyclobacteriaceae bacterium]|nr:hypothetical protein [Cyclobacteriaceae bacterium]